MTMPRKTTPTMNRQGEHALTRYLEEIGGIPLLTPEEEHELATRSFAGDPEAREKLVMSNLRFVVKIALDYEHVGLPILDLISEGNIGLIHAVSRFDPNKGAKLTTYAAWWIKQHMRRAIDYQLRLIRIPTSACDKLMHINRILAKIEDETGATPTAEQIGAEVGMSADRVLAVMGGNLRPASLDETRNAVEGEGYTFAEITPDPNTRTAAQETESGQMRELVLRFIPKLSEREQHVIRHRFGIDAEEETLDAIGQRYGLTRERIRQVETMAKGKLRRWIEIETREDADGISKQLAKCVAVVKPGQSGMIRK